MWACVGCCFSIAHLIVYPCAKPSLVSFTFLFKKHPFYVKKSANAVLFGLSLLSLYYNPSHYIPSSEYFPLNLEVICAHEPRSFFLGRAWYLDSPSLVLSRWSSLSEKPMPPSFSILWSALLMSGLSIINILKPKWCHKGRAPDIHRRKWCNNLV